MTVSHEGRTIQEASVPFPAIEQIILDSIDALDQDFREINQKIHDNPELGYAEFKAHDNIVAFLESHGFVVTPHAYGLETSFSAEYGSEGRVVTFCCEYDALPVIGHGCGHNLIAIAAIASFFGLVAGLKQRGGAGGGRVRLLGTLAEEGGAGKVKLINAGAFEGVDAAIMSHPFPTPPPNAEGAGLDGIAYGNCLAVHVFRATFTGQSAHGAVSPWLGANAVDAATLAYSAVGMLRQQTKPSDVIGLVIEHGGASSNVIPNRSVLAGSVRARTLHESEELLCRVYKCFEGAAMATGCTVELGTVVEPFADLRSNETICSVYTEAMAGLGKTFLCDLKHVHNGPYGTDMGNVSYVCPSYHGKFHVATEPGVALHSAEFTKAGATQQAHDTAISAAKGMAITGWRILSNDDISRQMKEDFEQDKLRR